MCAHARLCMGDPTLRDCMWLAVQTWQSKPNALFGHEEALQVTTTPAMWTPLDTTALVTSSGFEPPTGRAYEDVSMFSSCLIFAQLQLCFFYFITNPPKTIYQSHGLNKCQGVQAYLQRRKCIYRMEPLGSIFCYAMVERLFLHLFRLSMAACLISRAF